jgi:hypothetical protein
MHETRYEKDWEIWVWAWWGLFMRSRPAFRYWSNGLALFSYRRDVQKPGLGRATDVVGFPVREEGG